MKKDFNREKLIKLYVEQDMSLNQIALQYNTTKEVIRRNLVESGIEIVNKVHNNKGSSGIKNGMWRNDIDVEKIINMYQIQNKSIACIGNELGIDRGVVKRRLEKVGITIERKPRSDSIGVRAPMNKVFYKYKQSAIKRGYDFNLEEDYFHELIQKPCRYCGNTGTSCEKTNSGVEYHYTGIDRFDNTKGYVVGNVLTCCKVCNQMKSNIDFDVFTKQIQKIYFHIGKN